MDFMELAKKRYSVRKFSDKPVEKEKLDKILEAGNIAPTAKNQQPQRVYVLQSENALKKINELMPCVYGATTVLIFTYNKDEEWRNPFEAEIHSGVEDVSIAATHVMLRATELGLGTCWCNYYPYTKVEKAFNIPDNEKSVLVMPVGYPAEDAKPAPLHDACKDLSKTVHYL
jgi:nitroreductase